MSILIKGIKMPKNEELIIICSDGTVEMTNDDGCRVCEQKATELPPHGDLIRSLRTEFGDVPTEDICECDDCIMKSYVKDGDYSECVSRLGRAALEALEQIYESEE